MAKLYKLGRKEKTLSQWAAFYSRDVKLVRSRMNKGWKLREALETPKIDRERRLTVGDVTRTWAEWSKVTGVRVEILMQREMRGWPPERIVTPGNTGLHMLTIGDRTQHVTAWCRELGTNRNTFYARVRAGLPPEVAMCAPVQGKTRKKAA